MAKQNKKEVEKQKAEAHKLKLAEAKARRRAEPSLQRPEPTLDIKPTILIYCEGQNTEPSYFNKFKVSSVTVDAFGEGKNTLSLVKEAINLKVKAEANGKPFEQVWCVFDADPKPDNPKQLENFNAAVALAKKSGLKTAYSNQAFEYWLILHFEDHQGGAMPRTDYDGKLNGYLQPYGVSYDGNGSKFVTPEIFSILFEEVRTTKDGLPISRYNEAARRAKKNYENHSEDHSNPGKEESSTLVYQLVEVLLKHI